MKQLIPISIGLAAITGGFAITSIRPIVNPAIKPAGLEAQDSHAAASLLGQFRTSLSSWMFVRADLYLHNGVEMRPLTEAEMKLGKKGVGNGEAGKAKIHNDEIIVTVVPSKEQDFRGWLGDIERATTSYKDMKGHHHNNPKTTLPLFRLMTWLDPQFVPGWTTGATILRWDPSKEGDNKALAFLLQGLEQNPKSIDILTQIGFLYLRADENSQLRDMASAVPYLEKARALGIENLRVLGEQEREALLETYRWLGLAYRDLHRSEDRQRVVNEGLRIYPDDGVLKHLIHMPPPTLRHMALAIYLRESARR